MTYAQELADEYNKLPHADLMNDIQKEAKGYAKGLNSEKEFWDSIEYDDEYMFTMRHNFVISELKILKEAFGDLE